MRCGISTRLMTAVGHSRRFWQVCLPSLSDGGANISNRQLRAANSGRSSKVELLTPIRTLSSKPNPRNGQAGSPLIITELFAAS